MPEYYELRREVSYANFDHFLKTIEDDDERLDLSKQEAIVRAVARLRERVDGLFRHVDGFFCDDRGVDPPEYDDGATPNAKDPLGVFLDKLARSINCLSITAFITGCRLDIALKFRDVDDEDQGSDERSTPVQPLKPDFK